jgi:hypothetical protein
MENQNASIKVSISEGLIEISGSESFVTSQIDNLKELLKELKDNKVKIKPPPPAGGDGERKKKDGETPITNATLEDMDDIYVVDDDKIKIICEDIPGTDKLNKTLNIALLYAFASKKLGKDEASVDLIRDICTEHGCLDPGNFSTHIKNGTPQYYLDKGTGKTRTIKINKPGEKKALEVIEKIRQDGNSNS